jgi:uncharacterized protein (TIRG00374 family)
VAGALTRANFLYLLPAIAVFFCGVWLRSMRWRVLLGPALRAENMPLPPTVRLFQVLVVGFTVNNVLPARLGELARAYLLWHRERIEPGATIATIVLERVLDGLTLLTFAGLAALVVPFPPELRQAAWATAAIFLTATVGLVAFMLWPAPFVALAMRVFHFLPERFARLGEHLVLSFVDGLAVLRHGRSLAAVLALSLAAWLAEASMYYVIMLGFPFPARPEAALLGAAAANIGTMIPSSPGYVGTFDLPLQLVLTQVFGVAAAEATSYTLVLHAALVLPVVLLGAFFLWQDWRSTDEEAAGGLLTGLKAMRSAGTGVGAASGPRPTEAAGGGARAADDADRATVGGSSRSTER